MATPLNVWNAERIVGRLLELAAQHGVPNGFQLHEVANDIGRRSDVLAISRTVRTEGRTLNVLLRQHMLKVSYEARRGADRPARVLLEPRTQA